MPYKSCWSSHLTHHLCQLLTKQTCLKENITYEDAVAIKEQHCYIAYDNQEEIRGLRSITYGLRDGRNISIGSELFEFAEAMFDPDIMGWHYGYHQSILNTIMKCDKSM